MREVLDKVEKLGVEIRMKLEEYRREGIPEPIVFRYLYEVFQVLSKVLEAIDELRNKTIEHERRIENLEHEVLDILYELSKIEEYINNLSHNVTEIKLAISELDDRLSSLEVKQDESS